MDIFFAALKKTLVATIFVIFGLVGTYIPQDWNKVEMAHAGGATGGSTEPTQILNNIELIGVNIASTASWALDKIISFATNNLYIKDFTLDGIAWTIAKNIVQNMVQSLISWINSGFQGSPAFVQDLQGFLLNAADETMGEYLSEITGLGSFICSPFRLDIGVALATKYQRSRVNKTAPKCTLTGIINNIEGFTSGAQGSFSEGGWDNWFKITSQPEVYTPYGAYLAAEADANIRIVNAKGEQQSLLNFGDGFLSGKVCQAISGSTKQDCVITKPGKIIQEALTFNLDSGRQSLITADEFNEVISALLGQLANKAITGAAGLLGLGGGGGGVTGAPNPSFNYTPTVTAGNPALSLSLMQNARATQKDYNQLATTWRPILLAYASNPTTNPTKAAQATSAANDAQIIMTNTSADITTLNQLIADYSDPTATAATKASIVSVFQTLTLYTDADQSTSITTWDTIVNDLGVVGGATVTSPQLTAMNDARTTQNNYRNLATNYKFNLELFVNDPTSNPAKVAQAATAINDAQVIITNTTTDIATIDQIIADYTDPTANTATKTMLYTDFLSLSLYTVTDANTSLANWDAILN